MDGLFGGAARVSGMALFFSGLLFGAAIVFLWMFRAEGIRLRKNLYLVPVLALLAAPSFADSFGARLGDALTNPLLIGGGKYLVTVPADPTASRGAFLLTANVPGFRITDSFYVAGAGISLSTVVPGLEKAGGAGVSLPAATYFFSNGQFCAQAGYAWDLMQTPASGGPYFGVGFSLNSVAQVKAKRLAREAKGKK